MKVGGSSATVLAQLWATQLAQSTQRVAMHRSSPTDRPVTAPDPVSDDSALRRTSRHTLDIRV